MESVTKDIKSRSFYQIMTIKMISFLAFNYPVNVVKLHHVRWALSIFYYDFSGVFLATLLFIGLLLAIPISKRYPQQLRLMTTFVSGLVLATVGLLVYNIVIIIWIPGTIFIIFEVFNAIHNKASGDILLAGAFSLKTKARTGALILFLENCLHVGLITLDSFIIAGRYSIYHNAVLIGFGASMIVLLVPLRRLFSWKHNSTSEVLVSPRNEEVHVSPRNEEVHVSPRNEEVHVSPRNEEQQARKTNVFSRKYHQQYLSMAPGYILMILSGLQIGFGIFSIQRSTARLTTIYGMLVVLSWYIGTMLGVITGVIIADRKIPTVKIMYTITVFYIISGILILPSNSGFTILARLISGFGFGLMYLRLIIYCDEISSKKVRNLLISFIHVAIVLGLLILSLIDSVVCGPMRHSFPSTLFIGALTIVGGLISAAIISKKMIESPHFTLMDSKNENKAHLDLMKLRNTEGFETDNELENIRKIIDQDYSMESVTKDIKSRSFYQIMTIKMISFLAFNYTVNAIKLHHVRWALTTFYFNYSGVFSASLMFIGLLLAIPISKHYPQQMRLITTFMSGLVLGVVGLLVYNYVIEVWIPGTIFMVFEVFNAIHNKASGDILLAGAFSLKTKARTGALILFLESYLHVGLITLDSFIIAGRYSTYHNAVLIGFGATMILLVIPIKQLFSSENNLRSEVNVIEETREISVEI